MCNIIDIKFHFLYTCLLNHLNIGDQFMNLYIVMIYPTISPFEAFDLWWSVFVFENLGDYNFSRYQNKLKLHYLVSRLLCNVVIMYKAAKNPEFLGYKGKPFPG